MAIDSALIVEIDGGKIHFKAPGLNEFAFLAEFQDKNPFEQATLLLSKVEKVEGLVKESGEVVTKETLIDCSLFFFKRLVETWLEEINKAMSIVAEGSAKNESTPAS